MVLYTNGDSNTAGTDLHSGEINFSEILAQKWQCNLVNQAEAGCSNSRILRTTREYIAANRPDFVVIGWTTWEREEWLVYGEYLQINANRTFSDNHTQQRYQDWVLNNSQELMITKGQQWHDCIWQFHQELMSQKIAHLFFHSYFDFFVEYDQQQDWQNCFYRPYDPEHSYFWTLSNLGFEPTSSLHFRGEGHQCWAQILLNFINQNADIHQW
jgi:hypothetical protein